MVSGGEARIVAAAIEPGVVASEVARAEGNSYQSIVSPAAGALWATRAQRRPAFSPVVFVAKPAGLSAAPGAIEIEFATGTRMRITGHADVSAIRGRGAVLAEPPIARGDTLLRFTGRPTGLTEGGERPEQCHDRASPASLC